MLGSKHSDGQDESKYVESISIRPFKIIRLSTNNQSMLHEIFYSIRFFEFLISIDF